MNGAAGQADSMAEPADLAGRVDGADERWRG